MGKPVIDTQVRVLTNPIEIQSNSTGNSVQKSSGEIALSLASLPKGADISDILDHQLMIPEAVAHMEKHPIDNPLPKTHVDKPIDGMQEDMSMHLTRVNITIASDEQPVEEYRVLTFPRDKYNQLVDEFKALPRNKPINRTANGSMATLTLWQRFCAVFGYYSVDVKKGMANVRDNISIILKEWRGNISEQYAKKLDKLPLTPNAIHAFFNEIQFNLAQVEAKGDVSTEGRKKYSDRLELLIEKDVIPKKELKSSIPTGQPKDDNGIVPSVPLDVPLDGQFVIDAVRSTFVIGDQIFFDRAKEEYLGQTLSTALESHQKARGESKPWPIESFLSQAFINQLRVGFNASDDEITYLSYLLSQRATFFIAELSQQGYLAFPEGTSPFGASTHFTVTKDQSQYRIVVTYEIANPPGFAFAEKNADGFPMLRTYYYDPEGNNADRHDFVKTSVELNFRMDNGKPVVRLADEGIQYEVSLAMTKDGIWQ